MFGHKHEWYQIDEKSRQEDRSHGTFTRTIYYYVEECCKCGEKRKAIYNEWIHKPENDPDPEDRWPVAHAGIMVIGGLGHEKIS